MIGKITSNTPISKNAYADIISKAKSPMQNTPTLDITKTQYENDSFNKGGACDGCGGGCTD